MIATLYLLLLQSFSWRVAIRSADRNATKNMENINSCHLHLSSLPKPVMQIMSLVPCLFTSQGLLLYLLASFTGYIYNIYTQMTALVEMISSWRYLRYAAMNPLSHKSHPSLIAQWYSQKTLPVKMPWRVGIIGAASDTNEGPTNGQEGTSHGGWLNMTVLPRKKSFPLCRELLQTPLRTTWTSQLIWKSAISSFFHLRSFKKRAGIITANFAICESSFIAYVFSNKVAVYQPAPQCEILIDHEHQSRHLRSTMLHPPTSHPLGWRLVV